jgi:hypothetical protein
MRETSIPEAARKHGITVAEVEEWHQRFLLGAENALRSRPKDEARIPLDDYIWMDSGCTDYAKWKQLRQIEKEKDSLYRPVARKARGAGAEEQGTGATLRLQEDECAALPVSPPRSIPGRTPRTLPLKTPAFASSTPRPNATHRIHAMHDVPPTHPRL